MTTSGGTVVAANLDTGLLQIDTTGQSTYFATISDTDLWKPSDGVTGEIKFRLLSHDQANGTDGTFGLLLGDGSREWRITIGPDQIVTFENAVRRVTALPYSLLDGAAHTIGFVRNGSAMTILLDGVALFGTAGSNGSFRGIRWGDLDNSMAGAVEIDYLDWEHPPVTLPTGIHQRPSDIVGTATVICACGWLGTLDRIQSKTERRKADLHEPGSRFRCSNRKARRRSGQRATGGELDGIKPQRSWLVGKSRSQEGDRQA